MPKYSRTAKYEELRNRLQNDIESDIKTNDLNGYEARLNKINPDNFNAPQSVNVSDESNITHARKNETAEEAVSFAKQPQAETPSFLSSQDTYTRAFDNEYLNEYIKEVKQYNVQQGNAFSGNTDLDILKRLKGETPTKAVEKPFVEEPVLPDLPKEEKKELDQDTETIEVPFAKAEPAKKPAVQPEQQEYLDEDDEGDEPLTDTMSKEDIAAEVQRLISGAQKKSSTSPSSAFKKTSRKKIEWEDDEDEDEDDYDTKDNTRQRLLNETTQMRAQLDDYEDNLNEVSDKMQKTNQILNVVLIVLIIALMIVLGVVVYWILMQKGIL